MSKRVRVRFAPSPTGGLHVGGVRTVLYNYLFARRHGGDFILRIEDTDQGRYVEGAEQYIMDSLQWCGLVPDESPAKPGAHGPYRQSERKAIYAEYALRLVAAGKAYYAFDTPEELEAMREKHKSADNPSPQYNHTLRKKMRNSLQLDPAETQSLLVAGTPYVIRIKLEPDEEVTFSDMIRGTVTFNTTGVDDKVLLKADGMPTYHLAVVVDDHLMEITHAFRGEEWLPSAPVHILLWRYLFGEDKMPEWAHLPLILKPDGNGKLSKRDGDRLGFPVFAMNWTDPRTNEPAMGFRETGFLPVALVNLLAVLGWNDGSNQELFTMEELIEKFSMDRVHKGGAKFDFEKAKWFNHEWIKRLPASAYSAGVLELFRAQGIEIPEADLPKRVNSSDLPKRVNSSDLPKRVNSSDLPKRVNSSDLSKRVNSSDLPKPVDPANLSVDPSDLSMPVMVSTDIAGFPIIDDSALWLNLVAATPAPNRFDTILDLVKERCVLLPDFVQQSAFFFRPPVTIDIEAVKPKWTDGKKLFFVELIRQLELAQAWEAPALEANFKEMAAAAAIKPGELLLPLRVMLVGGKFGPHVFDIAALLGREETVRRIQHSLGLLA